MGPLSDSFLSLAMKAFLSLKYGIPPAVIAGPEFGLITGCEDPCSGPHTQWKKVRTR